MIGLLEWAAGIALAAWFYLAFARGRFWQASERLAASPPHLKSWPAVVAVVPARNEADVIDKSLRSLVAQDYPGDLTIVVVDDASDDGTAEVARAVVREGSRRRLDILVGAPLPAGWVGKMWAAAQGLRRAAQVAP